MSKETAPTADQTVPWDERQPEGMAAIEPTPEIVKQAYDAIMNGDLPPEIGDPAITARMIQERVRQGTFDQSMDPARKLPAWADKYLDRVVVVYGFHLNPSTIENPDDPGRKRVYAVCEVTSPSTGEFETVSCGGDNVLVQLVKAWEEKRFPFQAVLTGTKTARGYTTLWLKRPEGA